MIKLDHITKRYTGAKENTITDACYQFPDTGLYFLTGKSGSGKSTLLSIIGGMDFEFEGDLITDNKNIKELTEKERADYRYKKISFVFQDCLAQDKESVKDNLLKPLAISNLKDKEKIELIKRRLRDVGLEDKLNSDFENLSGGEKKRIALAKGLVKNAPILLADEPLASLNKNMRKDITSLLLKEGEKRLVIVITHEEEEIPEEAGVLKIINGHLFLEKETSMKKKDILTGPTRTKWSRANLLRQLYMSIKTKRQLLSISIISLVIALFSISFSFLLSQGVKNSLNDTITAYMSDNSLVISEKDESYNGTSFESSDVYFLTTLKQRYPNIIADVSNFYMTSVDDIFEGDQRISLIYDKESYTLNRFSLKTFTEALSTKELSSDIKIYGSTSLDESEVVLGIREEDVSALYLLLYKTTPDSIDEDNMTQLGYQLVNKTISLRVVASKGQWNYHLDYSFKIKGFFISDSPAVLHTDSDFNTYFVSKILQFKEILLEEEFDEDVPWTLKYAPGLTLYPGKTGDFLKAFLQDETCNLYVPQVLTTTSYYQHDDLDTHNRILIYKDYLPKLALSKVDSYVRENQNKIFKVMYSSPIYTCTASGYISGFQKPFFFSANLEELNYIQDSYHLSDIDLGAFQGSLMEVGDKVVKADLLSALEEDGLSFRISSPSLITTGKEPSNDNEIAISKGLAEKFFTKVEKALGSTLHALTLLKTEEKDYGYENVFAEGKLTIVGVSDEEDNAIYHEALFPLCYAFSHLELSPEEVRITQAVVDVDLENYDSEYYLTSLEAADLLGQFPIDSMLKEIESMLSSLSTLFLIFALLGLVTSAFLLFLALYLMINKDKKALGILLALGYQKKEICNYYFLMSLIVGLIAYVLSVFLSIFTELMLQGALEDILRSYSFNLFPYLISLFASLLSTGLTGIAMRLRINKLSPKDTFRRK